MDFMSNLTKGGQICLHHWRMLRQVLWITFLITWLSGLTFVIGKTWLDHTPSQRYLIGSAYWARFNLALRGERALQTYRAENGNISIIPSIALQRDSLVQLWLKIFKMRMRRNAHLSLWGMGILFFLICGFWILQGRARAQREILSGTKVVSTKDLARIIYRRKENSSLQLAGIPLIKDKEKQHMLIVGTTGSGKTNCFHELFQQIRGKNQRAIIVDMTGGFIEKYYRKGIDKILNPLDQRSESWNLWKECPKPYHLRLIASTLIPADSRGYESYWTKASRIVFMATAERLKEQAQLTTSNFFKYATNRSIREVESFYKGTTAAAIMNSEAAETVMGVRSNLRAYTECLEFFAETEQPFSIREWICQEKEGEWLFLSSPPELREEVSSLMMLWTTIATDALMSLPLLQNRRFWIAIDELPAIKRLPKLQTMLAEIRKYGGCIVLGAQDMAQLDEIYGANIVKSIANLCSTKVVFRIEGADVAERLSKWLGMQEVSEMIANISYGAHQMRDGVSLNDLRKEMPTIHPDRLMKLPDLEAYLKLPGDYPIAKVKFKIHELPKIAEGFVEKGDCQDNNLDA